LSHGIEKSPKQVKPQVWLDTGAQSMSPTERNREEPSFAEHTFAEFLLLQEPSLSIIHYGLQEGSSPVMPLEYGLPDPQPRKTTCSFTVLSLPPGVLQRQPGEVGRGTMEGFLTSRAFKGERIIARVWGSPMGSWLTQQIF
jgi:hypothetical protein